jgi:hypothetical protein
VKKVNVMTDYGDKNRIAALEGELSILKTMQEPIAYACITDEGQYTLLCYERKWAYEYAHNYELQVVALSPIGASPASHTDDEHVDRFANAMKLKLAACRSQGHGGWDDPEQCTVEHLEELLVAHLTNKGGAVDIANFCMMLHQRGKPQPEFHTDGNNA